MSIHYHRGEVGSGARDLVFPPISVRTGPITVTDVHVLSWRIIGLRAVAMVTGDASISRREALVTMKMIKMMNVMMRCRVVFRLVGCLPVMMMMMMMMMMVIVAAAGRQVDVIIGIISV